MGVLPDRGRDEAGQNKNDLRSIHFHICKQNIEKTNPFFRERSPTAQGWGGQRFNTERSVATVRLAAPCFGKRPSQGVPEALSSQVKLAIVVAIGMPTLFITQGAIRVRANTLATRPRHGLSKVVRAWWPEPRWVLQDPCFHFDQLPRQAESAL